MSGLRPVKSRFTYRLRVSAEFVPYRRKFRSLSKQATESYSDFAFKQINLCKRWLQSVNAWDTIEELRQAILMEQFLESCPIELTVWLIDRSPTSLSQMARFADQYVSLRKSFVPSNGTEFSKPAESAVMTSFKSKWSPKPFRRRYGKTSTAVSPAAPPVVKPAFYYYSS